MEVSRFIRGIWIDNDNKICRFIDDVCYSVNFFF